MTDDATGEQDIRTIAEASHRPRQVPQQFGPDPSNTPIEELVAPLDADEDAEARGMVRRELAERPELLAGLDRSTDADPAA